jgi:peptide methionine sulfoxide reductase MsrA
MHGRTPKVSHFHVFGCKCFILKKGKKMGKFEARPVDGFFFGYASHSRAYRALNLETNHNMEACEVTFDETQATMNLVRRYFRRIMNMEMMKMVVW